MTARVFNILSPALTTALGTAITYTGSDSVAHEIKAVWDDDYRVITFSDGIEVEGHVVAAHIKIEDITTPQHEDLVVKNGVSYLVYETQQNGPGMWTLFLELV